MGTVWALDPETKDLLFDEDGILITAEGEAASLQGVRLTLEAWKGDFELVPDHGTDYERILGEPADEEAADEVIREAVFQENSLAYLENLSVAVNGRTLEVSFTGCLEDGTAVSMEVKTDG